MSSSFTTRKRLEKQNPGENSNTWGGFLNSNMIDLVDEIFGVASVNFGTTAGDVTLSQQNGSSDDGRRTVLVLIGAPTSNVRLFVPAVQSPYIVRNKATGTKKITITPAGGATGVDFATGEHGLIYSNGTQCREIFRTASAGTFNGVPPGAIFPFHGSVGAIPVGYYLCDGTNGTPDLSNKFVLGTVSNGGIDVTGGAQLLTTTSANVSVNTATGSTVLASANIPGHTHYLFGDFAADINSEKINSLPGGTVAYSGTKGTGADEKYIMAGLVTTEPTLGHASWAYSSAPTGHTHTIAFEAGHKHTVTDGRPPYYAMIYIMKA